MSTYTPQTRRPLVSDVLGGRGTPSYALFLSRLLSRKGRSSPGTRLTGPSLRPCAIRCASRAPDMAAPALTSRALSASSAPVSGNGQTRASAGFSHVACKAALSDSLAKDSPAEPSWLAAGTPAEAASLVSRPWGSHGARKSQGRAPSAVAATDTPAAPDSLSASFQQDTRQKRSSRRVASAAVADVPLSLSPWDLAFPVPASASLSAESELLSYPADSSELDCPLQRLHSDPMSSRERSRLEHAWQLPSSPRQTAAQLQEVESVARMMLQAEDGEGGVGSFLSTVLGGRRRRTRTPTPQAQVQNHFQVLVADSPSRDAEALPSTPLHPDTCSLAYDEEGCHGVAVPGHTRDAPLALTHGKMSKRSSRVAMLLSEVQGERTEDLQAEARAQGVAVDGSQEQTQSNTRIPSPHPHSNQAATGSREEIVEEATPCKQMVEASPGEDGRIQIHDRLDMEREGRMEDEPQVLNRLAWALLEAVAGESSGGSCGGTSAVARSLEGEEGGELGDVLVKFPDEIPPSQLRRLAVQKRRSLDMGKRVLVRSMRKRRMSLGSRVVSRPDPTSRPPSAGTGLDSGIPYLHVAKGMEEVRGLKQHLSGGEEAGAPLLSSADVEVVAVSESEADALLQGYGWKGSYNMEWDPNRRMLSREEEARLLALLEPGQRHRSVRRALKERLGKEPSDAQWAAEAGTTVSALQAAMGLFQAAKNKLVMHNLGLVVSTARMYKSLGYGVDFSSLCQRGVKGLYDAADNFSSRRRCRFSTFASLCVRTVVTREIAACMHVRAPTYSSYKYMLVQRKERELELQLKRPPTDEEVATAAKLGTQQLRLIRRMFRACPALLHQEVAGTGGLCLADIVPDEGFVVREAGERDMAKAEPDTVRYALDDVIDSLKPKEAVVIRQRFGLDGCGERSLAEIGRNLSISREMVHKYEARALAKLRLHERTELFQARLHEYGSG